MNANLLAIVKQIVSEQGENILYEPRRVTAFFADLAKNEPKPLKYAFAKCLEYESAQALKNTAEQDREVCKQQLAQKLYDEEGLDLELCKETIELLAAVLFGEEQKKIYCKNCGKELREEWKICPYCSTIAADQAPETSQLAGSADPVGANTQKINSENAQLKEELEEAKSRNSQLNDELESMKFINRQSKEELKKTKSGRTTAIWLGIIGVAISIGVGLSAHSDMENSYNSMRWQYNQVKSNYDKLLAEHEASKSFWKINVTSIKVGNVDKDNRWLNNPGETLSSAKMRYLKPVITYNSSINEDATFYVKIINPYGTLKDNSSTSPKGFSNSTTARINSGSNQSLTLTGWGTSDESTYTAGTWTVEVWYNDVCLRSEKVVIGQ
ncbi:MAG: zinc ribbon domain-containing protein [Treponema sp.]|jgi:hypothetical protein|nr:zinc ribbon domain-containing protein [Treponema sp.]